MLAWSRGIRAGLPKRLEGKTVAVLSIDDNPQAVVAVPASDDAHEKADSAPAKRAESARAIMPALVASEPAQLEPAPADSDGIDDSAKKYITNAVEQAVARFSNLVAPQDSGPRAIPPATKQLITRLLRSGVRVIDLSEGDKLPAKWQWTSARGDIPHAEVMGTFGQIAAIAPIVAADYVLTGGTRVLDTSVNVREYFVIPTAEVERYRTDVTAFTVANQQYVETLTKLQTDYQVAFEAARKQYEAKRKDDFWSFLKADDSAEHLIESEEWRKTARTLIAAANGVSGGLGAILGLAEKLSTSVIKSGAEAGANERQSLLNAQTDLARFEAGVDRQIEQVAAESKTAAAPLAAWKAAVEKETRSLAAPVKTVNLTLVATNARTGAIEWFFEGILQKDSESEALDGLINSAANDFVRAARVTVASAQSREKRAP